MASADQIAQLRLLIAEPTDAEPYTETALNARIDSDAGDLNLTAYKVWTEKAAAAAALVDTSEGGSSRKMGDIYEQALAMAKWYQGQIVTPNEPTSGRRTVVSKMRRPA